MHFFVYILTNKKYGTLYVGQTVSMEARIWQHKNNIGSAFTQKYKLDKLVYYEQAVDRDAAKLREKQIKEWKRDWKINLIENMNPHWRDLLSSYDDNRHVAEWAPAFAGEVDNNV